jgi:hypothetical protein
VFEYHFIITVQGDDRSGRAGIQTLSSTFVAEPGETRHSAYAKIHAWAKEQTGMSHGAVLFFSFEPDSLGMVTEAVTADDDGTEKGDRNL